MPRSRTMMIWLEGGMEGGMEGGFGGESGRRIKGFYTWIGISLKQIKKVEGKSENLFVTLF